MDPLRLLDEQTGFFSTAQARDAGNSDRDIAKMVRSRLWHRIRRGYFTFSDSWEHVDPIGRHRVLSRAVLDSLGPTVALSHVSGAIEHGIATWGIPLDRVHVTRLDRGSGRIDRDVIHHEGICLNDDVTATHGLRVLSPARCTIEATCRSTQEAGLVAFDSLLHSGLVDQDQLLRQFQLMQHWPYVRRQRIPILMADGRAESPGESRGRWLFRTFRLPEPELQFEVYDAQGVLRGTSDWGWPEHGLLGEFDGMTKYGRLLTPNQDPADVIMAEKFREDELREITGAAMIRIVWVDYARPRVTAQRIESLLRRAA